MSIAYQCDRCGKLVAIPDIKFHIPIVIANKRDVFGSENREILKIQKLDLCPECNEELKTWIDEKKGDLKNGRDVCTGASKKGARNQRRKTRDADEGDTPSEG